MENDVLLLSGSADWYLGEQSRNHGSIHSDILQGFAADLAERGVIGVVPVSGWWKEQPRRDRSEKGAATRLSFRSRRPVSMPTLGRRSRRRSACPCRSSPKSDHERPEADARHS